MIDFFKNENTEYIFYFFIDIPLKLQKHQKLYYKIYKKNLSIIIEFLQQVKLYYNIFLAKNKNPILSRYLQADRVND